MAARLAAGTPSWRCPPEAPARGGSRAGSPPISNGSRTGARARGAASSGGRLGRPASTVRMRFFIGPPPAAAARGVQLVDQAQPLERQQRHVLVDGSAAGDQRREAAGREHAVPAPSSSFMRSTIPSTMADGAVDDAASACSVVDLPIDASAARRTRRARAARRGRRAPRARSRCRGRSRRRRTRPAAETASKVVAVPKSTTMHGPPTRAMAATALTMRSAPTSRGLSIRIGMPRAHAGPDQQRVDAASALRPRPVHSAASDGHGRGDDQRRRPRRGCSRAAQQPVELTARSSAVRSGRVAMRHVCESSAPRQSPRLGLRVADVDREQHQPVSALRRGRLERRRALGRPQLLDRDVLGGVELGAAG